jgi:hypothetical protein
MDQKERDQINSQQNRFLLQNFERLETLKNEAKEPIINRKGKATCKSVVEQALALYTSGMTHKQIAALFGMSISSAGRILRMNNHERRKY